MYLKECLGRNISDVLSSMQAYMDYVHLYISKIWRNQRNFN